MKGGSPSSPALYNVPENYNKLEESTVTPEGLSKALQYLGTQTNKKFNVKNVPDPRFEGGYFDPLEPGGGLYNKPEEAGQRSLFLSPNASYHTLFHEAGHGRDPQLRQGVAKEKLNVEQLLNLQSPAERLGFFAESQIYPRVDSEIEAEAYAGFQVPRFEKLHPELNINSKATLNDPWFKEYAASYGQKGLDKFYAAESGLGPKFVNYPTDTSVPGVATQVFQPSAGLNYLHLGLDKELQKKQQEVLGTVTQRVDTRLNPYQQTPATLRNYWGQ